MGVDLAVIETHPVQYHAPVYRALQKQFCVNVTAIYGSDFSIVGYHDAEFGATFRWDTDLVSGYDAVFLSRVAQGGARSVEEVTTHGLSGVLQRLKPRAVLLLGYSPRFHRQAFFQARRLKVPLLFRGETTDHARHRGYLKQFARDRFLRWFYRQFSGLLYVGKRSREHFLRYGVSEEKLYFSPYCVDTNPFDLGEESRIRYRKAVRGNLRLAEDEAVLLFSGKLSPRKAPDLLVRAVKDMAPGMRKRIVLIFLGDGPMRGELERFSQTDPEVKAHFLGFQNQTHLSRYYHAADLLILPSQEWETWGLVVNEAMHHGLPCVVSDRVGCAPDLIEEGRTGELFEAGSVLSLRQAIERAMGLVGREDVRALCHKKVSGYTVERAAEGLARAFQDVVERRERRT